MNKLIALSKSSINTSTTSKSFRPNFPDVDKFFNCFNLSVALIRCFDEPLLNSSTSIEAVPPSPTVAPGLYNSLTIFDSSESCTVDNNFSLVVPVNSALLFNKLSIPVLVFVPPLTTFLFD